MVFITLLFGLSLDHAFSADRAHEAQVRAIMAAAAELKPSPEKSYAGGVVNALRSKATELAEPVRVLAGPRGEAWDSYGRFFKLPLDLADVLGAHARLHNALLADAETLARDPAEYRLPTYVDESGRELPPAMLMRYEVAGLMYRALYLPRAYLGEIIQYINGPLKDEGSASWFGLRKTLASGGIHGLLKHSPRGREFVDRVPSSFASSMRAWDLDLISLVDRLSAPGADLDMEALRVQFEDLEARGRHISSAVQYVVFTIGDIINLMIRVHGRPVSTPTEMRERVDALGRGLKASLRRASDLREVFQHHHSSYSSDPIVLDGPEILLARIEHDLHYLFAGGGDGWHFTNLNLGREMRGPDGHGAIAFYNRALILKYVLVTSAEINRVRAPSSVARLLVKAGVGRNNLPAIDRGEFEAELWSRFFRASGLSERILCAGYLETTAERVD